MWRLTRERHAEIINPSQQLNSEDRQVEWLTYKNVKDWNKRAKEELLSLGMVSDKPRLLHGVESEISLVHPDDAHWFITVDKTHHKFLTKCKKGGSTAIRYTNLSFPRSGDRSVESMFHTTGVYGTTLAGEAMPPLFILNSNAKFEENYTIDPNVYVGLPIVNASYGSVVLRRHHSSVSVRRKGSMDTGFWHQLVQDYVKLFAGAISPKLVFDPLTNKLVSGPVIIKTDGSPGRLAKEAGSAEVCAEMFELGVYIMLLLPNATSCTTEMDQMYEKFKPSCKDTAKRIIAIKMKQRLDARRDATKNKSTDDDEDNSSGDEEVEEANDNSDAEEETGDMVEEVYKTRGRSVCNVIFSNLDLGHLVNGWPGDPVKLCPFDFNFTVEKIKKSWLAVGFLPMTGAAAFHPKLRHELGEGGAPEEAAKRLQLLRADYQWQAGILIMLGYRGYA